MMNHFDPFGSPYNRGPAGPGGPPRSARSHRERERFGAISWVADIALIGLCFPVGLVLTVLHANGIDPIYRLLDRFAPRSGGAAASAPFTPSTSSRPVAREGSYRAPQSAAASEPIYSAASSAPSGGRDAVRHADSGSRAMNVFGWVLLAFGAIGFIDGLFAAQTLLFLLTAAALALGGAALLVTARRNRRKEAAFKRCLTVTEGEGIIDISKLTRLLGVDSKKIEPLLAEMIDRGYYGERAYIDHQRGLLVLRPEDMRDVFRREDEAAAAAAKEAEFSSGDDYDAMLLRLRRANNAIEDPVMTAKIDRIEAAAAAIFARVRSEPSQQAEIHRFMSYYVPTTIKLLESYANIEQQGVVGANMAKAKSDIESIADTLVEGFEKQLDRLYRSEAADISGDVRVVESMLRRDGLAGGDEFASMAGGK